MQSLAPSPYPHPRRSVAAAVHVGCPAAQSEGSKEAPGSASHNKEARLLFMCAVASLKRRKRELMHKPIKYVEKAVTVTATAVWAVFERLNRIKPNPSPTPKWSDKPLLKSFEKSKPPLGWPRTTDSLCPKCVPEIRQQILDGKLPVRDPAQRKGRRDQGADRRARWQDPAWSRIARSTATSKT